MRQRQPLSHTFYTALELKLIGGSEWMDGAREGRLRSPLGMVWEPQTFSLDEANKAREEEHIRPGKERRL